MSRLKDLIKYYYTVTFKTDLRTKKIISNKHFLNYLKDGNFDTKFRDLHYDWFNSILSSQSITERFQNPLPCLSFGALKYIENFLNKDSKVFEWGSGTSTLWFSKISKIVFSIEHNTKWFKVVKGFIEKEKIMNTKLRLIAPSQYSSDNIYCSGKDKLNYEIYAKAIDDNDKVFDLILIDGRARVGCIFHSVKKIKPKGLIVLDNSQRERYEEGKIFLARNGFKETIYYDHSPYQFNKQYTSIFQA